MSTNFDVEETLLERRESPTVFDFRLPERIQADASRRRIARRLHDQRAAQVRAWEQPAKRIAVAVYVGIGLMGLAAVAFGAMVAVGFVKAWAKML
jgi:hypothetical protein